MARYRREAPYEPRPGSVKDICNPSTGFRPRLEAADQILAIADTLLAAKKRVVGNNGTQQPDYYAILQLVRFILNPNQNRFPYSDQAFQLVNEAWTVLSNPMQKSIYDSELDFAPQQMNLGFNLEQQHHQQHNFFSINQEIPDSPRSFQNRLQQSHQHQQLQQHNFLSQPNPSVGEQDHLFQHREQEQLFQPQVQPPAASQPPFSWQQEHMQQQLQQKQIKQEQQQQHQHINQEQLKQQQLRDERMKQQKLQQEQLKQQQIQQEHLTQQWMHEEQMKQQRIQEEHINQQRLQDEEQFKLQQLQQEQLKQQQKQQQESLKQNAFSVQLPTQVSSNNGVREEETAPETEGEEETEAVDENDDDSPTFWTSCPYCFYMYEYSKLYADYTLRCDNCKRVFQAVRIFSPPTNRRRAGCLFLLLGIHPSWSFSVPSGERPFSPLIDASKSGHSHLNECAAPKKNTFVHNSSGPRIYFDDIIDDSSDIEWDRPKKNNLKRMKKVPDPGFKKRIKVLALVAVNVRNGSVKNLKHDVGVRVEEISKKVVINNPTRQSGQVAKESGKLDLNVEFNNNEGEEPA